jgi:hypothetical protein
MIGQLNLDFLNIKDNRALTDAGLKHLFNQKKLVLIRLDGTQFDLSAIQLLAAKIHLNHLLVGCNGWTDEKKGQFRRSLAPCMVEFEDASKHD